MASAARSSDRSARLATERRSAPSPSTATARATGAASGPSRARRVSTVRVTARGPMSRITAAWSASGGTPSAAIVLTSSCSNSGLPPVALCVAWAKRPSGSVPSRSRTISPMASAPRGPGCSRIGCRVVGDLAQQRGVGARLAGAKARGQQQGQALEPLDGVGQEAQRGHVAPVQVVHRDHQRLLGGQVRRQPVQAVQGGERGVGRRAVLARRGVQDLLGRGRGPGQQRRPRSRVGHGGLEQLAHHAEGELALQLAAAGAEHPDPGAGRPLAQLGHQAALADAGAALDQQRVGLAALEALQDGVQRGHLAVAVQQERQIVQAHESPC